MLRHIVMYRFQPQAEGRTKEENLKIAATLGEAVGKEIPQLRAFTCGIGSAQAAATNYDVVLICDLDDFDALAAYKQHPAHKAFGAHCHAVCETRAAIDFEI